jgi:hypothetical protein
VDERKVKAALVVAAEIGLRYSPSGYSTVITLSDSSRAQVTLTRVNAEGGVRKDQRQMARDILDEWIRGNPHNKSIWTERLADALRMVLE